MQATALDAPVSVGDPLEADTLLDQGMNSALAEELKEPGQVIAKPLRMAAADW